MRRSAAAEAFCSTNAVWIAMAQRTACSALLNSTRNPSPMVLSRPLCWRKMGRSRC